MRGAENSRTIGMALPAETAQRNPPDMTLRERVGGRPYPTRDATQRNSPICVRSFQVAKTNSPISRANPAR